MERGSGGTTAKAGARLNLIDVEPAALRDIERASSWYENQRAGLGVEFILELDRLLEHIGSNPRAYQQTYRTFRRALLRRFPYAVYFTVKSERLRLYGVLHQHRSEEQLSNR